MSGDLLVYFRIYVCSWVLITFMYPAGYIGLSFLFLLPLQCVSKKIVVTVGTGLCRSRTKNCLAHISIFKMCFPVTLLAVQKLRLYNYEFVCLPFQTIVGLTFSLSA